MLKRSKSIPAIAKITEQEQRLGTAILRGYEEDEVMRLRDYPVIPLFGVLPKTASREYVFSESQIYESKRG